MYVRYRTEQADRQLYAAERVEMIVIAAYHRAARQGFSEGSPEQDWLEAETEIDQSLDR